MKRLLPIAVWFFIAKAGMGMVLMMGPFPSQVVCNAAMEKVTPIFPCYEVTLPSNWISS